ncbi:immunity 8 family protein [Paraburkholderia sp. RL17-381-BIF-C]|jgi:hypothetical protein|uniref:immunity 8 family protein n=1 Tax=Paraburkholderia sp. RL17-381-BIF-C TaxID=3031635 RepID=UPI0038B8F926
MHAVVKSISSDESDIAKFLPEDMACFSLSLRVRIGSDETSGADDFELCVCTPEWLRKTVWEPRWGRHLLIVREYDLSAIEQCIRDYVAGCHGSNWSEIAGKLARVFGWEFEDYQG